MAERIHPDQVSPSFCILPWIHLSTRPNGHMRVCCTANASSAGATNDKEYGGEVGILKTGNGKPANLGHTGLLDAWNGPYMKQVRQQMLNGEIPPSCTKCFKEEKAGHRSKRIWETEYWSQRVDVKDLLKNTTPEGEVPPTIMYIDLRLGTKCNLKCIMCSPHDSSRWVGDWRKLDPQIQNPALKETMQWRDNGQYDGASYSWFANNDQFWTDLDTQLPHLHQLYFAGGESTIIEEHYKLLEKCIEVGEAHHIELRYNSNGLELPDRIFELWKHFKRVRFHFSIDSIGEMNHYIRFPSEWSRIETQLRRLDESDASIEVTIACAVQILNIYYIPDFIRWKMTQGYKKINPWPLGAGLINFHFVYHPAHLNVKVLPAEFKKKVAAKYEEFYVWLRANHPDPAGLEESGYGIKRLKGLVSFMMSEDWSNRMPEFQEYIQLMDKIRNVNFGDVFPEMKELVYPKTVKHNISVVIPCHNEENAIDAVLGKIRDVKKTMPELSEIIVVNDGSTDKTAQVLAGYSDVTVLTNPKALGYGGALKVGFAAAKGDLILFMDMDDTYDIQDLPKIYQHMQDQDLDVVFGNRLNDSNGMPGIRRFGNNFYHYCLKLFRFRPLTDPCTGMRLFKKELATSFCTPKENDLSYSMSLTLKILKSGLRYGEVPIRYHERIGESKLNPVTDGGRFFWTILINRF